MTDKIVTHADLPMLRNLRTIATGSAERERLIDRLIAAAEADAPPLPEGWVVYTKPDGSQSVIWHHDGVLWITNDCTGWFGDVGAYLRDRLTPLRPTVTEADVEKAAVVLMDRIPAQTYADITRDMLRAAGVEVQP